VIHRFLSSTRQTAQRIVSNAVPDFQVQIGHLMVPATNQEAEVMEYICTCSEDGCLISAKDFLMFVFEKFGKETLCGWG
jgi:hypothetical protein